MDGSFNIRVYGLFINSENEILLADEERFGMKMTKFPGGGLHYGEGTIDCLKREALEEFGQEIEVLEHFYTTDFFQEAYFFENMQLISIYYLAKLLHPDGAQFKVAPIVPVINNEEILSFRFKKIAALQEEELSFPIDRHVLRLLKRKLKEKK